MEFKPNKILSLFSKRSSADKSTGKELQEMLLKAKELNKQLNTSPEIEEWSYKIIKNNFIKNQSKTSSGKQSSLFGGKKIT